jgi:hypothetical protein
MNNPLRYSDPSGYLTCDGGYDSSGECIGSSDTSGGYGGTNSGNGSDHHSSSGSTTSVGECYGGDTNIFGTDVPNGVENANLDGSNLNMPEAQNDEHASYYSGLLGEDGFGEFASRIVAAVVGGTEAGLGDGGFANGAWSGSFGYALNEDISRLKEKVTFTGPDADYPGAQDRVFAAINDLRDAGGALGQSLYGYVVQEGLVVNLEVGGLTSTKSGFINLDPSAPAFVGEIMVEEYGLVQSEIPTGRYADAVVLGHEFGHKYLYYKDVLTGGVMGENISLENRLRSAFGMDSRKSYHGTKFLKE